MTTMQMPTMTILKRYTLLSEAAYWSFWLGWAIKTTVEKTGKAIWRRGGGVKRWSKYCTVSQYHIKWNYQTLIHQTKSIHTLNIAWGTGNPALKPYPLDPPIGHYNAFVEHKIVEKRSYISPIQHWGHCIHHFNRALRTRSYTYIYNTRQKFIHVYKTTLKTRNYSYLKHRSYIPL